MRYTHLCALVCSFPFHVNSAQQQIQSTDSILEMVVEYASDDFIVIDRTNQLIEESKLDQKSQDPCVSEIITLQERESLYYSKTPLNDQTQDFARVLTFETISRFNSSSYVFCNKNTFEAHYYINKFYIVLQNIKDPNELENIINYTSVIFQGLDRLSYARIFLNSDQSTIDNDFWHLNILKLIISIDRELRERFVNNVLLVWSKLNINLQFFSIFNIPETPNTTTINENNFLNSSSIFDEYCNTSLHYKNRMNSYKYKIAKNLANTDIKNHETLIHTILIQWEDIPYVDLRVNAFEQLSQQYNLSGEKKSV